MNRFWGILRKILLFGFLLLIPTQLGKHFWPDWSYVLGIRVDYLSPTLYFVDLFWLGWVLSNLFKPSVLRQAQDISLKKGRLFNFRNLAMVGFMGLNILVAASPMVAIYRWMRIGQILITINLLKKNKKEVEKDLQIIVPCWIVLESLLAWAQMAKNGSLNGIFYWLGERSFTFNTIGIAQISVLGRGLIRAYGTFSHPNSLAGFLLVSLGLWYWLKPSDSPDKSGSSPPLTGRLIWWVVTWLGLLGILAAGSRTIWLLTGVLIGIPLWKKVKNGLNIVGLILLFLGMAVFGLRMVNKEYWVSDFLGGWDSNGWEKRIDLNMAGLKMIRESTWLGLGLGNFLVRLPEYQKNSAIYWLQPAHNILILALSEVGILGLVLLWWGWQKNFVWKKINWIFKLILIIILVSGMVDHYWLTLPQNMWLMAVVLGLI